MEALGNIFSIVFFGWISLQDFRSRSVYAFLLPAAGTCFLLSVYETWSGAQVLENMLMNSLILGVVFSLAWLFVCLKRKALTGFINEHIGLGDIIFLFCLAPVFSVMNFILFFVAGTTFCLIASILVGEIRQQPWQRIPYAGLLSVPLIIICLLHLSGLQFPSLTDESWLTSILLQ